MDIFLRLEDKREGRRRIPCKDCGFVGKKKVDQEESDKERK